MIQKLRWKFIAITMTIVTLFLTTIFVTLYFSTKANYLQQSMSVMRSAMREPMATGDVSAPAGGTSSPAGDASAPAGNPSAPRSRNNTSLPLLTVEIDANGQIHAVLNRIPSIEETEIPGLIAQADAAGTRSGTLGEMSLRFLKEKREHSGNTRYVFADIYSEVNTLHWQIVHSIIIGISAFGGFFLFAIFLSRWAVRPVEHAWNEQRQFVADASHELKTPLTVILSNANMLTGSGSAVTDEKSRLRIEHIRAEAERMRHLVESLLILARSDTLAESPAHQPVDFSYVINKSITTFEPVAFDSGKEFSTHVEDGILINGNETTLRQLTDILLDNACKYSPAASTILVSLSHSANGKEAILTVSSEGTPLTKKECNDIFLRFYRADPSRSNVSGYGLGLPIARSIAAEHNGKIEADTDGVSKNMFLVRLPLLPG